MSKGEILSCEEYRFCSRRRLPHFLPPARKRRTQMSIWRFRFRRKRRLKPSRANALYTEKGGANLVSVTVDLPEALSGMTARLGENEAVGFSGMECDRGLPLTAAKLIYEAFCPENTTFVRADENETVVGFDCSSVEGKLRFESFSAVPVSLETDGFYMEFQEFKR